MKRSLAAPCVCGGQPAPRGAHRLRLVRSWAATAWQTRWVESVADVLRDTLTSRADGGEACIDLLSFLLPMARRSVGDPAAEW